MWEQSSNVRFVKFNEFMRIKKEAILKITSPSLNCLIHSEFQHKKSYNANRQVEGQVLSLTTCKHIIPVIIG